MIVEDFYTGEPLSGSPSSFPTTQSMITSNDDIEAANMASFAKSKYDLNPGIRTPISSINPGAYGYNNIQPGIGMGNMYSPYGNVQPSYSMYYNQGGYGYNPNPVLQQGWNGYNYYQNPYYQQPQPQPQQPTVYHIPGVGTSGEFLPPLDYQDKIDELKLEYWNEMQKIDVETSMRQASYGNYGGGYYYGASNYYGMPYFTNPYQYNDIDRVIIDKVKELENEARENRIALNMQLSTIAHNFAGDTISDADIERRYRGIDVDIPEQFMPSVQYYQEQARYDNVKPFDNSQMYRDFHNAVSKQYTEIVGSESNMKEAFLNLGILDATWEMEEEMHRRRDASGLYNSGDNSYKYFVRRKAQERYAAEKGISLPGSNVSQSSIIDSKFNQYNNIDINKMREEYANSLPTLSGATIAEDGTLTLPCNFGSHIGESYSVHNSNESEYDKKSERFKQFASASLSSIADSIYLNNQKEKKIEEYSYD